MAKLTAYKHKRRTVVDRQTRFLLTIYLNTVRKESLNAFQNYLLIQSYTIIDDQILSMLSSKFRLFLPPFRAPLSASKDITLYRHRRNFRFKYLSNFYDKTVPARFRQIPQFAYVFIFSPSVPIQTRGISLSLIVLLGHQLPFCRPAHRAICHCADRGNRNSRQVQP